MNQIRISTTVGQLFWLSVIGYIMAFAGFYGLTQYTQARIAEEESTGVFAAFKASACNSPPACSEFTLTNSFDSAHKQLITQLSMPYKSKKSVDEIKLQQDYSALIAALPWYVKRQFAGKLEINAAYNMPLSVDTQNKTYLKKSIKKT